MTLTWRKNWMQSWLVMRHLIEYKYPSINCIYPRLSCFGCHKTFDDKWRHSNSEPIPTAANWVLIYPVDNLPQISVWHWCRPETFCLYFRSGWGIEHRVSTVRVWSSYLHVGVCRVSANVRRCGSERGNSQNSRAMIAPGDPHAVPAWSEAASIIRGTEIVGPWPGMFHCVLRWISCVYCILTVLGIYFFHKLLTWAFRIAWSHASSACKWHYIKHTYNIFEWGVHSLNTRGIYNWHHLHYFWSLILEGWAIK